MQKNTTPVQDSDSTPTPSSNTLSYISAKFNGSDWISGGEEGYPQPSFAYDSSIQGYIFGGMSMTHMGMDDIEFYVCSLDKGTYKLGHYN